MDLIGTGPRLVAYIRSVLVVRYSVTLRVLIHSGVRRETYAHMLNVGRVRAGNDRQIGLYLESLLKVK